MPGSNVVKSRSSHGVHHGGAGGCTGVQYRCTVQVYTPHLAAPGEGGVDELGAGAKVGRDVAA